MVRKALGLCAVLLVLATPGFAATIMLDLGPVGSTVQAGWTGIDLSKDYAHGTPFDLGGGVTAGYQNYNAGQQDRTRSTTSPLNGLGYDDVLIDFIRFDNPGGGLDNSFLVKGLPDGTYNVTVYGFDGDYGSNYHHTPTINGTQLAFGPPVSGNIETGRGTLQVTLSSGAANNVIQMYDLVGEAPDHGLLLNGIVIEAVTPIPEPATLVLLGLGASALFLRRRKA